ncbi:MAG TPA: hypothetical protein VFH97_04460, partial [Gemmatimonadales bacterium]|nr:hypothetical protein [Gemmatimonadales bacterium]
RQPPAGGSQPTEYGLIAEEVLEVFPELVALGADGQPETVRYHVLPALLLNELQRQEHELASLRAELERLGGLVAAQAAALDATRRAK